METKKELAEPVKRNQNLKIAATILLIFLLISVVRPLIAVFQTRFQLLSPLIPEKTIWEINKQFIFIAIVSAVVSIVGLILYFYEKYLWIIILVLLTLLSEQYIHI